MAKKVISLSDLPVVGKNNVVHLGSEIYTSGAVLLMDKPLDWTSFDVVNYVRNRIPPKKVGHAGTLDPLASGLLILCSGKATKSISQIQELDKTYEAKIKFGASTPSYDAEAEPDKTAEWSHISPKMISEVLQQKFTGQINQVPPAYSAIKVKGERMYKLARRGEEITLEPRKITIYEINILDVSLPDVTIHVRCGKGTYIRSLAHDLGIELGSRAHLTGLRRTATGHFDVKSAITPEEFNQFPK
jgi:tRNA pseudouridine55 synthase